MIKKETRGRKRLAKGKHKAPQATLKINEAILPFVIQLKSNLKMGLITDKIINKLLDVMFEVSNEAFNNEYESKQNNTSRCGFNTQKGIRCKNKVTHVDNFFNDVYVNSCEYHYKNKINVEYEKQLKGNL